MYTSRDRDLCREWDRYRDWYRNRHTHRERYHMGRKRHIGDYGDATLAVFIEVASFSRRIEVPHALVLFSLRIRRFRLEPVLLLHCLWKICCLLG